MINITETVCRENANYLTKTYILSNNIQACNILEVVRYFETDTAVMSVCYCSSFDENGHPLHREYSKKEDLLEVGNFPNPYINFSIDFNDIHKRHYVFSLILNTNVNIATYVVDKRKLPDSLR